jgi:7-cyano-7-deazaguanine synthase
MAKAIVLLSGGLDSTVTLAQALRQDDVVKTVNFQYGQTHSKESLHAAAISHHYMVRHETYPILYNHVNPTKTAGALLANELDQELAATTTPDKMGEQVSGTFVPGRNIVFLAYAGGMCDSEGIDHIYMGVNAVDYSGYPDCRPRFIDAMTEALYEGLRRKVKIFTPLIHLSKAEIIKKGVELGAPLHRTWSCYTGEDKPCGKCPSCKVRIAGFAAAGLEDPALHDS